MQQQQQQQQQQQPQQQHAQPGASWRGRRHPPSTSRRHHGQRRGVAAAGATLDFNKISPPEKGAEADPLWEHTVGAWGMDMAALIVLGVICGFFVARFLRRHEPEVMRK
ncbi:hypothetical protein STENM327S_08014 [Streptomyces tendae]